MASIAACTSSSTFCSSSAESCRTGPICSRRTRSHSLLCNRSGSSAAGPAAAVLVVAACGARRVSSSAQPGSGERLGQAAFGLAKFCQTAARQVQLGIGQRLGEPKVADCQIVCRFARGPKLLRPCCRGILFREPAGCQRPGCQAIGKPAAAGSPGRRSGRPARRPGGFCRRPALRPGRRTAGCRTNAAPAGRSANPTADAPCPVPLLPPDRGQSGETPSAGGAPSGPGSRAQPGRRAAGRDRSVELARLTSPLAVAAQLRLDRASSVRRVSGASDVSSSSAPLRKAPCPAGPPTGAVRASGSRSARERPPLAASSSRAAASCPRRSPRLQPTATSAYAMSVTQTAF